MIGANKLRAIVLFFSLFGFYALLSGQFHSTYLMVVGAICCALIVALSSYMRGLDREGVPFEHWSKTFFYIPWLLWQILLSNLDVARRVWSPKVAISPCVVTIPHRLRTPFGIATYANSITLTPGTVTVDIGASEFLVHALTQEAAQDLLGGDMHKKVLHVEGSDVPSSTRESRTE